MTTPKQQTTPYTVPAAAERAIVLASAIAKEELAKGNLHEAIAAQKTVNYLLEKYPKLEKKLEE